MSADILPLTDNVLIPDRPSEDVVACAKELLRMAEAGEIAGLAYVTINPTGQPTTDWALIGRANGFIMVGAIARLLYRMNRCQGDDD